MRMCGGSCPIDSMQAHSRASSVILNESGSDCDRGPEGAIKKPSSQTRMLLAAMMRHISSASLELHARRLQGLSWRTLFNQCSRPEIRSEIRKLRLTQDRGRRRLRGAGRAAEWARLRGRFELQLQLQVRLLFPSMVLQSTFSTRTSVAGAQCSATSTDSIYKSELPLHK